jgi:hypothetical protein
MTETIEFYISGTNSRTTYANENRSTELYKQLQTIFPWVKKENYVSVSTPNYHEVLDENVITCQLPSQAASVLIADDAVLLARKFCMSSEKSYLRAYYLYKGGTPDWLPASCTLMCYSNNIAEYGRPFPAQALTFTDYYFSGDPATVEEHFDLPERRGAHATFYGVTREGDTTRRVKQYCYDEKTSSSEWTRLYNFLNEGS